MLYDGLNLVEGSVFTNLVIPTGTSFPSSPDSGEMFYRTDVPNVGLYVYDGTAWNRYANSDDLSTLGNEYVLKSGSTMTGTLVLSSAPTLDLHAATKKYVDDTAAGAVSSIPWSAITGEPTTLGGYGITDAQPINGDLNALAALTSTGMVVRTGSGTANTRLIEVTGTGLSITNANGVSGNPTIQSNATSNNTISTLVARDESGNFSAGNITATTFSGSGELLTSLNASNISSGTVATARLGSGTADSTTFLRGDNTWTSVSASNILGGGAGQIPYQSALSTTSFVNSLSWDNATRTLQVGVPSSSGVASFIRGPSAASALGTTGITIQGETPTTTSRGGGAVRLQGGNGSATGSGDGGEITITGGNASGTSRVGGSITLVAGISTGGEGGGINISPGVGPTQNGKINLNGAYTEKKVSINATGSTTINCSVGNNFVIALNTSITSLTLSNVPSNVYSMTMFINQGGSATIVWPAAFKWSGGTAPTLTLTSGKTDIITCVTHDGGITWYGFVAGQNF